MYSNAISASHASRDSAIGSAFESEGRGFGNISRIHRDHDRIVRATMQRGGDARTDAGQSLDADFPGWYVS